MNFSRQIEMRRATAAADWFSLLLLLLLALFLRHNSSANFLTFCSFERKNATRWGWGRRGGSQQPCQYKGKCFKKALKPILGFVLAWSQKVMTWKQRLFWDLRTHLAQVKGPFGVKLTHLDTFWWVLTGFWFILRTFEMFVLVSWHVDMTFGKGLNNTSKSMKTWMKPL